MKGKDRYYKYSDYLKKTYGTKVYKLPVNLPITCPNRTEDGGCTFCSEKGTGFEAMPASVSVERQLETSRDLIRRRYKTEKFIAYFQNYTNTFMPLFQFRQYMQAAACTEDVVELAISTRPDCIADSYLKVLAGLAEEDTVHICIELGLQTVNYHTLDTVRRGHGLAEYVDAMLRIAPYGFSTCTHVILNLPGDSPRDCVETAKLISVLGTTLVKIHSLYIAKGTVMAEEYANGRLDPGTKEDYYERLKLFLEYLSPDISVERLFSRIPEEDSLFSNWGTSWWKLQDEFLSFLESSDSYQGKCYHYRNGSGLRGVFNDRADEYSK